MVETTQNKSKSAAIYGVCIKLQPTVAVMQSVQWLELRSLNNGFDISMNNIMMSDESVRWNKFVTRKCLVNKLVLISILCFTFFTCFYIYIIFLTNISWGLEMLMHLKINDQYACTPFIWWGVKAENCIINYPTASST